MIESIMNKAIITRTDDVILLVLDIVTSDQDKYTLRVKSYFGGYGGLGYYSKEMELGDYCDKDFYDDLTVEFKSYLEDNMKEQDYEIFLDYIDGTVEYLLEQDPLIIDYRG